MNPSLTDLYLAELQLLLPATRRGARFLREVRDHIADATEERVERGVPPIEAEADAIAGMGAPDIVADQARPELRPDDGFTAAVATFLREVCRPPLRPAAAHS